MKKQNFEKKSNLLYIVVIMVLCGLLAGEALSCPPVHPPCWPCCGGDPGPCVVCTPGGWGPKCKDSECKYCKESTGECLSKCKCGAPCTGPISCGDPPTACWYCDESADDCGEGENCCAYGPPDYQYSECYDILCEWCNTQSGPQPVEITNIYNNHMGLSFIFYVLTVPWGEDGAVLMKFDDGPWESPTLGTDFFGRYGWYWLHDYVSCAGEHIVEAKLCDSDVTMPFSVCDTSYPTCEQCDPLTGWCIPTTPCYGSCCDWKQCMSCDYGTHTCKSNCNPALCEDCNFITHQCEVCNNDPAQVCCDGACCNKAGCEECYGDPVISIGFADGSPSVSYPGHPCPGFGGGSCGQAGPDGEPSIEVKVCYQDCKWRFGATGKIDYCFGPSFNYIELDYAGIASLSSDCRFLVILSCETDSGCTPCAGGTLYARTSCVMQHEQFHYEGYCSRLAYGEVHLRENPAFDDLPCPGGAASCEEALSERQAAIEEAVKNVFNTAAGICDEIGAMNAARPCNMEVASEIRAYWGIP